MQKKNEVEQPESSSWSSETYLALVIATLIIVPIIALIISAYNTGKEFENNTESLSTAIGLVLTEKVFDLNDEKTPYHYLFSYEIDKESTVFNSEYVYTYEFDLLHQKHYFPFGLLNEEYNHEIYQRVKSDNGFTYVPVNKMTESEKVKIVGVGLSAEDIQKKHPKSLIIGEEFPDTGELMLKASFEIEEDIDIVKSVAEVLAAHHPFPEEEEK